MIYWQKSRKYFNELIKNIRKKKKAREKSTKGSKILKLVSVLYIIILAVLISQYNYFRQIEQNDIRLKFKHKLTLIK